MKKIIGIVTLMFVIGFGGAIVGYNVGYDDAMAEVETRVLDGINQMGDMFNVETE